MTDKNHEGAAEQSEKPADQDSTEGAGEPEGKAAETTPTTDGD